MTTPITPNPLPCGCEAAMIPGWAEPDGAGEITYYPPVYGIRHCALHQAAPALLKALDALQHIASVLNNRQHAGLTISPAMWSILYDRANEAYAIVTMARSTTVLDCDAVARAAVRAAGGESMNINEHVKVRLTDFGREILLKHWQYEPNQTLDMAKNSADTCNPGWRDGEVSFSLWELMAIFGPHVRIGMMQIPFERNEVILP